MTVHAAKLWLPQGCCCKSTCAALSDAVACPQLLLWHRRACMHALSLGAVAPQLMTHPWHNTAAGASSDPTHTSSCGAIAFAHDLNAACPAALAEYKDGAGATTECRNQCGVAATKNKPLCNACTGSSSCVTNANSLAFKNAAPSAYSFSYDDATSTYTCRGADYQVQFGVLGEKAFYIPL